MPNFVFYDFETSSSNKFWGQIIQIGAILTNDNLEELDRFDARCRLNPGIVPEAMALIVNKSSPKMLKNSNLSHYEMIRQFVDTLKKWGKASYIGFNSIEFDEEFLRSTLFQTLEYPYLTSTNGNTRGDILGLARAANLYYPKTLKNSVNDKGNDVYKLDQMAPLNGIEHGDAHSAIGDVIATVGIAKIIANKAPNVWKASQKTMDKTMSLELIKKEHYFCTNEYFYGKSRPYVQTFVCQHPKYQWPLCFDLKHDPRNFLDLPIQELAAAMKKNPKFLRTVRHNKHPVIMNPSYSSLFEEYKINSFVDDISNMFVRMVANRRNISIDIAKGLSDGRVYTGQMALKHGLIDAIGGRRDALKWLEIKKNIPEDLPIITLRTGISGMNWLERLQSLTQKVLISERLVLDGLLSIWQPSGK